MFNTKDMTRAEYAKVMEKWRNKLGNCRGDGEDAATLDRLVDELHRVADDHNVGISSRAEEPSRRGRIMIADFVVWGSFNHGNKDPDTQTCSRDEFVLRTVDGREWVFPVGINRATIRARLKRMKRELATVEAPTTAPTVLKLVQQS